jgi:hypothetical protein
MSQEHRPSVAVVVAVIGAVGVIAAAVIQSGLFSQALSGSAAAPGAALSPAGAAPASPSPIPGGVVTPAKALPNEIRDHVVSVKVKYGCAVLYGSGREGDDADQLHVCQNTPVLLPEWMTKVKRVSVDCATVAGDHILVFVYTGSNYSGPHWEYAFGC